MPPEPTSGQTDFLKRELIECGRDFHHRGWSLGTSSNYSVVIEREPLTLLMTGSGFDKGRLQPDQFVMVDEKAQALDGDFPKPSAEALLHTSVMITLFDLEGRALYRNPAARDAVADPHAGLAQHFADASTLAALRAQLDAQRHGRMLAAIRTVRGERWHEVSARSCRDALTGEGALLLSEVDISELKRTEARAHHLARHDSLTGLPNRNFVIESFSARLAEAREAGDEAALLFIDLDRFKRINDTLGHDKGDMVLQAIASRINTKQAEIKMYQLVFHTPGFFIHRHMKLGEPECINDFQL